jgi:hypothetical protein
VPYIYDFTTKLLRLPTEALKTNEDVNVYNTGQVETHHEVQTWRRSKKTAIQVPKLSL